MTLAPPAVREDFAAGITALHDFWFEEAVHRFKEVQRAAPNFVLGYWGEAMAQHRNPFGFSEPPVEEMRAILAHIGDSPEARAARAATDHERGYLAALELLVEDREGPAERHPRYVRSMAALAKRYPKDVEALAFHARAIMLDAETFGRSSEVRRRTAEAAARVLAADPNHHGGLHYFIHGKDAPDEWREAVEAADRYQLIATGASHAVHMPSHIYMQGGLWDRVVAGNEKAVQTSMEWVRRTGRSRANLDWHAVDFLLYAYLQQGRELEARRLLEQARTDRRDFDTGALRWYDALWSARYASELGARSEVPLPRSGYSSVGESLGLGLRAARAGEFAAARSYLAEIDARIEGGGGAEWRIARAGLAAVIDPTTEALSTLREAIELQAQLPRPNETPDLVKPPEELLGELLLRGGDLDGAEAAFLAGAARWPARLATRAGLARVAAARGDSATARDRYADVLVQLRLADVEHPVRVEAHQYLVDTGGVPTNTRTALVPGQAPGTLPEVERRGSGTVPLVIIPCMSCRWRSFDTFMERNSDRYTMYAMTLPGFGGTPLPDVATDSPQPLWYENAVRAVVNLIVAEELRDVVLVGHSYGTVTATGVAAQVPDRIRAMINVDGSFMSDRSWFAEDLSERHQRAAAVVADNLPSFLDAESWRAFNGSRLDDAARRSLYHGMFMATDRTALLQYWRDNHLVDLNALIVDFEMPILDLQTVPASAESIEVFREQYRAQLRRNKAPEHVHTVFLANTSHFVMEHRPQLFDSLVSDFVGGDRPSDFAPNLELGTLPAADLAARWVGRLRGLMEEGADTEDLDRLLELYGPDAEHELPAKGEVWRGHDAIRAGLARRLAGVSVARPDIQSTVVAEGHVVVTVVWSLDRGDGDRSRLEYQEQAVSFEIREGRIQRVVEYVSTG